MGVPRNYIGRCIYCDSTKGLTREHVIPEGLGGNRAAIGKHEALVLGAASCEKCTPITRDIEGAVLGNMMGHFRETMGLRHKRRRKKVRTVHRRDGTSIEMPIENIPPVLFLPRFGFPGLIEGRPIGAPALGRLESVIIDPSRAREKVRGRGTIAAAKMTPGIFGQMLAKIALGWAVANIGFDSFRPLVREFILNDVEQFGHWLGSYAFEGEHQEPFPGVLHRLSSGRALHDGVWYLVVEVWLFASLGGPRNFVIVGEDLREPPESNPGDQIGLRSG